MLWEELKVKIEELRKKSLELEEILELPLKVERLKDLEKEAADSRLWENPEHAKRVLQEKKGLEKQITGYQELKRGTENLVELLEIAEEKDLAGLEEEFEKLKSKAAELEISALLKGAYDKNNAILSINAGAGGTDAQDWAQILLRMYSRFAERKGYVVDLPDLSYGEEAGIKSATLVISGLYAYGYLKVEAGIHRLVRISPFSAEGKRHTSFASVEVIPEITEEIKVEINPHDLRIETFRASGPGGQNVNKVSSAVRITHLPTGIVAQSQSDRSQHANREAAMKILKARLYERMLDERKERIEELRGEKRKIEWGNQIRSYVFHPYTLVKDHRTGVETPNVQKVIDGDLDLFIEEALKAKIK